MCELDVGDNPIRRDLAFIADAGHAIAFIREDSQAGRTMVRMRSPSFIDVPITRREAHTFAGSRRMWEPLRGTPFFEDFENLYQKVVETLPPKERAEIDRDCARFFCIPDGGVLPYEQKRQVVEELRLGSAHRFVRATLMREEFEVPRDFKLDDHFDGWGMRACPRSWPASIDEVGGLQRQRGAGRQQARW